MGVFTHEDKVIIRYLRQKYRHGAKRLIKDNPEKDWKPRALNNLLQKIDATNEINRKKGSGRPKTARSQENIEAVEELICSQEEPGQFLISYFVCFSQILISLISL